MSPHVAPDHTILLSYSGYPVVPKFRTSTDSVLQPHSFFFVRPWGNEIIHFVKHAAVVCREVWHIRLSPIFGTRQVTELIFELTAIFYGNCLFRLSTLASLRLHSAYDIHAVCYRTEDDVLPV